MRIPRLVIAGTSSGTGKTTIVAGLIAALRKRGLAVQSFKCGPDYIDPTYHTLAAGRPCRNLDSWMLSSQAVTELFLRACRKADIAVIEGVMGLYDGRSGKGQEGSTAEMAKFLDAPVVLVVDVGKMARSAGAMALGYRNFDDELDLVGVILNSVGSPSHLESVTKAIQEEAGLPVLGHLPKRADIRLPERHLGLVPTVEGEFTKAIGKIGDQVAETVDIEGLLRLARSARPLKQPKTEGLFPVKKTPSRVKIAFARDEAFSFYYEDNLDLLSAWGAGLIPVSPMRDQALPADIQGLYMGGGFPEIYASELAANASFTESVRRAAQAGLPLFAECGGLMYLCEGIIDQQGGRHEMVGLLPGWSVMASQRVRLGYVEAEVVRDNILSERGQRLRGHEFHWSQWEGPMERSVYFISEPTQRLEGYARKNVLASYVHLHFGSEPSLAKNFIASCEAWQGVQ